jgi:uncharacterized protein HemX
MRLRYLAVLGVLCLLCFSPSAANAQQLTDSEVSEKLEQLSENLTRLEHINEKQKALLSKQESTIAAQRSTIDSLQKTLQKQANSLTKASKSFENSVKAFEEAIRNERRAKWLFATGGVVIGLGLGGIGALILTR